MAILALRATGGSLVTQPRIHTSEYPPVWMPATPIWRTVLAGAADRGHHPALVDGVTGQTIS